jgi:tRNA dimethylallyltransferase
MAVARAVPGTEIVSVDSMQVYRGMDIGTAKPTAAERNDVPHHLIDLADPAEEISVVRFADEARRTLEAIAARGARPLLVGGTGLYFRAVIDRLEPPGQWPALRAELEADTDLPSLYARLARLDPTAAARIDPGNRRRVVRALEVCLGSGRPFSSFGPGLDTYPATDTVQVGLRVPREVLAGRIAARVRAMLDAGLLDEVRALHHRPGGLSRTARQALGYKELLDHLEGRSSLTEAVDLIVARTRRFAARQERWFRRDPRIHWVDVSDGNSLAVLPAVLQAWFGPAHRQPGAA